MQLILSSAGSYPRIGDAPDLQRHRRAYAQLERGEISAGEVTTVEDEGVTRGVREQVEAGGGGARARGGAAPPPPLLWGRRPALPGPPGPAGGSAGPGLHLQPQAPRPDRRPGVGEATGPRPHRRPEHEAGDERKRLPRPRRGPPRAQDGADLPDAVLRAGVPPARARPPQARDAEAPQGRLPPRPTMSRQKLTRLGVELPLLPTSTVGSFPKTPELAE